MNNKVYQIITKDGIKIEDESSENLIKSNKKIEIIWQKELSKKPTLFNGELFTFIDVDKSKKPITVKGKFVQYKIFLASRVDPTIGIKLQPVGVSGVIIIKENMIEYVLFSTRSTNVTDYANYFELVPSGNIDKKSRMNLIIDYKSILANEFVEETGLSRTKISGIEYLCFVYDKIKQIYDVCCILETTATRNELIKSFKLINEYKDPQFIPVSNLANFVKKNNLIVPTSLAIIDCLLKKDQNFN